MRKDDGSKSFLLLEKVTDPPTDRPTVRYVRYALAYTHTHTSLIHKFNSI